MSNMRYYLQLMMTPKEAKKTIQAGRLKGFTDIQPMYRVKRLTEVFGPCGIGWKYEIVSQRIETAPNGEAKAFVDINLYYKDNGEWSAPIPGIGGNAFLSKERNGDYVNDECFKSALSDAIGTACKALGMCADVYYSEDRTKYSAPPEEAQKSAEKSPADYVLNSGRYKGKTLGQVMEDPDGKAYLERLANFPNIGESLRMNIRAVLG